MIFTYTHGGKSEVATEVGKTKVRPDLSVVVEIRTASRPYWFDAPLEELSTSRADERAERAAWAAKQDLSN